ncbi:DNA-processing protein DprA [Enteractinococcus fodinae]|uniref:DNA processing protein n=1 Tax=Enteractinococcus fodinae TaxID=684663 RepID=A0ABU2B3E6_9MICC|nr:DNA-processing protein DprA [Enteractinococcus fodinae]MDR7346929.1 DNA processing protein [Enteractinococcus fodinae]
MADSELRHARAGLTQVIEPADNLGTHAAQAWGPIRLLEIIQGSIPSQQDWIALAALDPGDGQYTKMLRHKLGEAIDRWRRRGKYLQPETALHYITKLGGKFLVPEDPHWPPALADLEGSAPLGLWTLGEAPIPQVEASLAIVGSRESTSYGDRATTNLVAHARGMGLTVVSGGAYGIDATAHRAALERSGQGTPTVAVLAGGLDRLYPAGNTQLLQQIAKRGLLITEMPPGMRPNRYRFLNRNRLIAALSAATIVVEARYRSGALSTANHAHDLDRTVGAVPGPINVPTSAGCHRLIKESPTQLVDDATDLDAFYGSTTEAPPASTAAANQRNYDILDLEEMLVFDALPVSTTTNISHLTGLTGLPVPQITGILTRLERYGLAAQTTSGWKKRRDTLS